MASSLQFKAPLWKTNTYGENWTTLAQNSSELAKQVGTEQTTLKRRWFLELKAVINFEFFGESGAKR